MGSNDFVMKILITCQHYWPENFRITEIAEELVKQGHDVTVLTGLPNYPTGRIDPEYRHKKNRTQIHNGVKILRAALIGRRQNILFRLLNYYSFPFFANRLVQRLNEHFDVVLINELSPIMASRPGIKYAKKHHVRCVMYEMDLWPHNLLAGGIAEGSFVFNHYKKVSAKIYSSCDEILVSSKEHRDAIHSLPGCENVPIHYLPQCAESLFEESKFETLDNGVLDLVFAGNIGFAQNCETILQTAILLKDDPRFLFHFVGDGSDLPHIRRIAESHDLKNVVFHGRQPLPKMLEYYALADAMLVSLEDKPYARMTIPGKVQSYIASGKPIVGAISGATANLIQESGAGWCVEAGDSQKLAELLRSIDAESLALRGKKGREYYLSHMKKADFVAKLIDSLQK